MCIFLLRMEHFAQRKPLISVLSNKECLLDKGLALGISLSLELFFEKYNGYFFMSAF